MEPIFFAYGIVVVGYILLRLFLLIATATGVFCFLAYGISRFGRDLFVKAAFAILCVSTLGLMFSSKFREPYRFWIFWCSLGFIAGCFAVPFVNLVRKYKDRRIG